MKTDNRCKKLVKRWESSFGEKFPFIFGFNYNREDYLDKLESALDEGSRQTLFGRRIN